MNEKTVSGVSFAGSNGLSSSSWPWPPPERVVLVGLLCALLLKVGLPWSGGCGCLHSQESLALGPRFSSHSSGRGPCTLPPRPWVAQPPPPRLPALASFSLKRSQRPSRTCHPSRSCTRKPRESRDSESCHLWFRHRERRFIRADTQRPSRGRERGTHQ